MQSLETVEVLSGGDPAGSVIWLHGLGADGHDFEPIVPELRLPESLALRFVFPHASVRPVTINGGMAMRAWYDILSLDADDRADADGVRASSAMLENLIEREIDRGIPANKIVIAGFSQGGAVAIHTALHTSQDIAGVMALSTYMALSVDADSVTVSRSLPIFMAHGRADPVLPMVWGRASADRLNELGFTVDWHEYAMAHAVCTDEIAAIAAWLTALYS